MGTTVSIRQLETARKAARRQREIRQATTPAPKR